MKKLVILISGRGSNMQAIAQAPLENIKLIAVLSDKQDAPGLKWAHTHGYATEFIDPRNYENRIAFDTALSQVIDRFSPDLIALAGFMRVLSTTFCQKYAGKLINIHPSLLPLFPGLHTHERALASGMKVAGCTVHFVTPELDAGPIISQAVVPIFPDDNTASLADRVLKAEHQLYPAAICTLAAGRIRLQKNAIVYESLVSPSDPSFCLLYTSPSPRDATLSRMPSSA